MIFEAFVGIVAALSMRESAMQCSLHTVLDGPEKAFIIQDVQAKVIGNE